MSWFKVDDGFADHTKVLVLQTHKGWKGALALWTLAGSWSSKQLSDGFIPSAALVRFGATAAEADLLVRVGLWDTCENGYVFHDWHEQNPSRAHIEEKREATRERVTRHRVKRGGNALHAKGVTPLPSRPVPTRPDPKKKSVDGAAPPPDSAIEDRVEELAGRYPPKLLGAVHTACRLSRTTGKMSDSKWLAALESFAVYDIAIAVRAMEVFADRYADGSKGERYLLGIMRGERDQPAQRGLALGTSMTREDAADWHPTQGAPKAAHHDHEWNLWIADGCPNDPTWKPRVAS